MSIAGGAIVPPLYGVLVDSNKQELILSGMNALEASPIAATASYWVLIPCYVIILFFAFKGHKIQSWK